MGRRVDDNAYLEGAKPYDAEAIKDYTEQEWWLNLKKYDRILRYNQNRDRRKFFDRAWNTC